MEEQYGVCGRCNGMGTYTVGLGPPGTDTHTPVSQIRFTQFGPYKCDVCLGTGWRKPAKERPISGAFHVHTTKAEQMSFEEIFDAMSLPTHD